jgi:hypothetical protein
MLKFNGFIGCTSYLSVMVSEAMNVISTRLKAAQRLALPAGGWDETTPLCRNQLQATQTAQKRADSHQSGARCVRRVSSLEVIKEFLINIIRFLRL